MERARLDGCTRRAAQAGSGPMAAPSASAEPRPGVAIPGAWQRDVVSRGGHPYRLLLWRPSGPPPAAGWPVTYLLDGNAVFGTAVEIAAAASMGFGPTRARPGAVVAIGYPVDTPFDLARRTLDLTPPGGGEPSPRAGGAPWPPSGGADALLDFVEGVVKPLVAQDLVVDASRQSLIGHSFGGLLTLHCLFTRPRAFACYVAASPSIWWNGRAILATERAFVARGGADGPRRLLLTVGSEEQPSAAGPATDPHVRRQREARMVDNAREMAARLRGTPNLSVGFHVFAGEGHGSVIPASVARGLRFAADQNEERR